MADLVVIVPTRGRPEAAAELAQAFSDTSTAATCLHFAVDRTDPALQRYLSLPATWTQDQQKRTKIYPVDNAAGTMVCALNARADISAPLRTPRTSAFAIGFMGDDHRPRTKGWDTAYLDALHELGTGLVYGNDLLQGPRIPTQVAMTSDIVRALGYMAPPEFTHLWVDNFWLELGNALGAIRYLPDVVVEHMHPLAGKGDWDDGYRRVNSSAVAAHDQAAFDTYMRARFAEDVAKVRLVTGGWTPEAVIKWVAT